MIGNVIICGGPRAGTTSIYRYLISHPNIVGSSRKEMNYFLGGGYFNDDFDEINQSHSRYLNNFDVSSTSLFTLEASPVYMHPWALKLVPGRIYNSLPEPKLIFILRDPVKRLFSQYVGDIVRSGRIKGNVGFNDYVSMCLEQDDRILKGSVEANRIQLYLEGLSIGKYSETLTEYLNYFNPDQIHVIFFENFVRSTSKSMSGVCDFIGLDKSFYEDYHYTLENKQVVPRNNNLYSLALGINRLLEPLLQNSPYVRNIARSLHNYFNSSNSDIKKLVIDPGTQDKLEQYFLEDFNRLKVVLSNVWGIKSFPDWLERSND